MNSLYVVATPIGNLEDITVRAIKTLLTIPVITCEDTRHTGNLIKLLRERYAETFTLSNNLPKYISVRDWNEADSVSQVLLALQNSDVALVSDAGTPLISDPGFKLVRAARAAQIPVVPIPGANAAIAALSAAGLPTDRFVFLGFLPKKWDLFPNITHVIYESPHRLHKTLTDIKLRYPESKVVVASELTKIHESITDNLDTIPKNPKGEFIILVNSGQS